MGFPVSASDQLEKGVTDEAESNSFRDAESDGHDDEGQERWYCLSVIVPADMPNPSHHERTDQDEGRRDYGMLAERRSSFRCETYGHRNFGTHHLHQRGKEQTEQEKNGNHDCSQARPTTLSDAGTAFNVTGDCGSAEANADDRPNCVRQKGFPCFRQRPVFEQACLRCDTDESAHSVKDVKEQEHENDRNQIDPMPTQLHRKKLTLQRT